MPGGMPADYLVHSRALRPGFQVLIRVRFRYREKREDGNLPPVNFIVVYDFPGRVIERDGYHAACLTLTFQYLQRVPLNLSPSQGAKVRDAEAGTGSEEEGPPDLGPELAPERSSCELPELFGRQVDPDGFRSRDSLDRLGRVP